MPTPEGKLTPVQFEIMRLVWNSPHGLSIGEIWDAIRVGREVTRTTILNLVDRLEKRGWLKRRKDQGKFRYAAARKQEAVEMQLASEFVDEFFAGSAANLVMSLLGSQQIPPDDIERLKQLLNQKTPGSNQPKGKSP